jgi:F420-dependent oxidoreductase-like protein
MRLGMMFAAGDHPARAVEHLREFELAGLEQVMIPESYAYDAFSIAGYIAARTERLVIGTGIVNVFSRTPATLAMTAATIDALSGGRFVLGLGASGAQVIEGFHGVPYVHPVERLKECTDMCRMAWSREPLSYRGKAITVPLEGDGALRRPLKLINRPVRSEIPIWWASVMARSVRDAATHADGWMPAFYLPEKAASVWGDALAAGLGERPAGRPQLEIAAGGILAVGAQLAGSRRRDVLDLARPKTALYVGGMGSRETNFYNRLCRRYGFEQEATAVQDLFLSGDRSGAERAVPEELLELTTFVGPRGLVRERVEAFRSAGVTTLLVEPVGDDPVGSIEAMRSILDELD